MPMGNSSAQARAQTKNTRPVLRPEMQDASTEMY